MFTFIKQIFAESDGSPSSMRVMSFEIVQVGLFIAIMMVLKCSVTVEMIGLAMGLITLGLTGKVSQKFTEAKAPESEVKQGE